MIGQQISHYRIQKKLGGGGMGVVYQAEDTTLGRSVALKFLPEQYFSDPQALSRFRREARSASALNHPHICTIYELGEHEGQPFIAMEHLQGETLKARLQKGPLSLEEALPLAVQMAWALEAAHSEGVLHRDIKPANIFVTSLGQAKVLDFGLAKQLISSSGEAATQQMTVTALTQAGSTLGTPAYMSPEQVRAEELDGRSDIFSLGIVLYEMLAGSNPFAKPQLMETASAILTETPPGISDNGMQLPASLQGLLERMLAKDPAQRPESMAEVKAELEGIVSGQGLVLALPGTGAQRWVSWASGTLLLLLLVLITLWATGVLERGPPAADVAQVELPRVAVLPFDNLSGQPEDEAYSDGLTESLITRLAQLKGLQVIARNSIIRYKKTELSAAEIAAQLKVAYVLAGSLLKAGDQCRVSAQLMKIPGDSPLWADDYRMTWSDIFTIQDAVTARVMEQIQVVLLPEEREKLGQRPTQNIEAYDAYLKGLFNLHRYNHGREKRHFEAAERLLLEAVALDAGFAEAIAQLGWLYYLPFETEGGDKWLEKSKLELERALGQDASNVTASFGLGRVLMVQGKERDRAWNLYHQAAETAPNDARAQTGLAMLYYATGRFYESSFRHLERAVELDPFYLFPYANMAFGFTIFGQYQEALEASRKALEIDPGFYFARMNQGFALLAAGQLKAARSSWEQGHEQASPETKPVFETYLGVAAAAEGDRQTVRRLTDPRAFAGLSRDQLEAVVYMTAMTSDVDTLLKAISFHRDFQYRDFLLVRRLVRRYAPASWQEISRDSRFQEVVRNSFLGWQETLGRWGGALPVPPPVLPTPDEIFEE